MSVKSLYCFGFLIIFRFFKLKKAFEHEFFVFFLRNLIPKSRHLSDGINLSKSEHNAYPTHTTGFHFTYLLLKKMSQQK